MDGFEDCVSASGGRAFVFIEFEIDVRVSEYMRVSKTLFLQFSMANCGIVKIVIFSYVAAAD